MLFTMEDGDSRIGKIVNEKAKQLPIKQVVTDKKMKIVEDYMDHVYC